MKHAITILLATLVCTFWSCSKNSNRNKSSIDALIMDDMQAINHSDVYLKFGFDQEPKDPTTNYDLKVHGNEHDNRVHIEGLHLGKYYLYAVGVNTLIARTVKGGKAIEITKENQKTCKEITINVQR